MSGKNTLVNVEGEIDAGWTSYWGDSDKHGQTVEATERGNSGQETMNLIPEEAENPEDLSDRQRRVIEAAVLKPEASSSQVAEAVGFDIASGNVRNILREKVPNWYDESFVTRGKSNQKGYGGEDRKHPVRVDMTVEEALEELGGQGTSEEVAEEMGQSKHTVHSKLNAAEGDTVEAHYSVEGYHNRTKVFTLDGRSPVPKDKVGEESEEEETTSLGELFDAPEEEEETEETTEDTSGFTRWEKGEGSEETTDEKEKESWTSPEDLEGEVRDPRNVREIRTVCEYEAQGDGEAANLAQYVLDRL